MTHHDRTATFGQDPAGDLQPHAAGAADDQKFLALELVIHECLSRRSGCRLQAKEKLLCARRQIHIVF